MVDPADVMLGIYYDDNNQLWFGTSKSALNYGDVDLRQKTSGPKKVRLWLDRPVQANWQFDPTDIYQSVAVCPSGKEPRFGQDNWPVNDFDAPTYETPKGEDANACLFIPDKNVPNKEWEYTIRLFSKSGASSPYVMDPKIINGSD